MASGRPCVLVADNGLVEQLGGPETPGIGFGLGVERLLLVLDATENGLQLEDPLDVYVGDRSKCQC